MSAAVSSVAFPGPTILSLEDEMELRVYFALDLPIPPGMRSAFGAMCDRLARGRNPKTAELPSNVASWTEILECGAHEYAANVGDAEDEYIAYIDARSLISRIGRTLAQIAEREENALRAFYTSGADAVDALTATAMDANRARAAANHHETVRESILHQRRAVADARGLRADRDSARATIAAIRREATELLEQARASYARAKPPKLVKR